MSRMYVSNADPQSVPTKRVVRHASLLAASVVVRDADSVRAVLLAVYRALELSWDPRTAGGVARKWGVNEGWDPPAVAHWMPAWDVGVEHADPVACVT